MRKVLIVVFLLFATNAFADEISLFDWGLYLDGNVIRSTADLPENVVYSDSFFETGLGTVSMTFASSALTDYNVAMFFDHENDELTNTYFNEYGLMSGVLADPRLFYEIDEPGFGTADSYRNSPDDYNYIGDIYDNFSDFSNRGLDNTIFFDGYTDTYLSDFETPISDDVSMAMGWKFSLSDNETAVLEFTVTNSVPLSGFYLTQLDRNSLKSGIYLQSHLNVSSVNVPEPGMMSSIGIGMAMLCFLNTNRRKWRIW
jgi:hypothetical protein